ncbi:MAG: acyl--CoA ligase [Prevotella sp.]|nr:acyl--CoA ligase [Prevotella sp.]
MTTIEHYIHRNAELYPDKIAMVCLTEQSEERISWAQVDAMVDEKAELLRATYQKGQVVCLKADFGTDFLITYFALHRMGCVAAPMERNMPEAAFQKVAGILESQQVPKGSADILYTTGTTGQSKGVIISHEAIIANAENLISGQMFQHNLAFVINGPLNHIGSLSKIYPIVMLGATMVLTDGLKDMNIFFKALDYPEAKTATFLVPASIRIIIQMAAGRLAELAHKIDFIETGAAAISHSDMLTLCRLLPHSRLYNTYASTETGIISTYNFNDGRCIPGCLGKPMRHSNIIITPDGLIACGGKTLMTGYVNGNGNGNVNRNGNVNGNENRNGNVNRNENGDGLIYTSDIGHIDEEGMLHLEGRSDDVINVGGYKVAPTEVENATMTIQGVRDCVCIAVENNITGSALKLLVVIDDGITLNKKAIATQLKERLEPYKIPLLYEQVDTIKRTFNGKIDRKQYSKK